MFQKREPEYQAKCIQQPEKVAKTAGSQALIQWTLKNTGKKAWPKGVQCLQTNSDVVIEFKFVKVAIESDCCQIVRNCQQHNSLGIDDYSVDIQDEVTIIVEVTMPEQTGEHSLKFRLSLQGEQASIRFGDEVCLSLISQASDKFNLDLNNPFAFGQ